MSRTVNVNAWVDIDVDLDDFDTDELIEELESRGYNVSKGAVAAASDVGESFDMVEHFAVCGLPDAAREEAIRIASKAIGRPI
jgi:hypothetical protein